SGNYKTADSHCRHSHSPVAPGNFRAERRNPASQYSHYEDYQEYDLHGRGKHQFLKHKQGSVENTAIRDRDSGYTSLLLLLQTVAAAPYSSFQNSAGSGSKKHIVN